MQSATIEAPGPEETRTTTSARFERLKQTKTFEKDKTTRVYTLAQSLEHSRGIVAPCANRKWMGEEIEYHSIVRDLTNVRRRQSTVATH
jgi:hypothetical protein